MSIVGAMDRGDAVGSRMNLLGSEKLAYTAGFLDGDGCIAINYEKHDRCRLGFRVRVRISFTQHRLRRGVLDLLYEWIGSGTIAEYEHNDMAEYVIRDQPAVEQLLLSLQPFLVTKRDHAEAALRVIDLKREGYSPESLERMRYYALLVRGLNRYPKRTNLDPVTTEALSREGVVN